MAARGSKLKERAVVAHIGNPHGGPGIVSYGVGCLANRREI